MTDVEMQAELRHAIEKPSELARRVVMAGEVFDHDTDASGVGSRHHLREAFQIHFNHKGAIVKGRVAVGMNVDPFGAELAENFDATAEFLGGAFAQGFERAAEWKVIRGVANDSKAQFVYLAFDRGHVDDARARSGRFQREVDEIQLHLRHPAKFADNVASGMIHRADFHRSIKSSWARPSVGTQRTMDAYPVS